MSRNTQAMGDRMLTVIEAAGVLGLAPGTLNKGRVAGGDFPPYVKIGRSVRYRESSLQNWVNSHGEHFTVAQEKAARKR
jgi:predicted DNA-binding transcriptional regulator AlpA